MIRKQSTRRALIYATIWALATPVLTFMSVASPELTWALFFKACAVSGATFAAVGGIAWCIIDGLKWAKQGEE